VSVSKGRMYEIIRAPVITEKSTIISEHNQVSFKVPLDASKPEIKAAIEGLFKVKVMAVNTLRQKGKVKRFRGHLGKQSDYKKAIITLADGDSIDITSGV
jgi:large subunit ribosomal protein L23